MGAALAGGSANLKHVGVPRFNSRRLVPGGWLMAEDKSGSIPWSRRDRSRLVKDILLSLAWGAMPKTRLAQQVGLSKKLFDQYVEGILVRYGLVTKKKVHRSTYYTLTRKGRVYLTAMTLGDVATLIEEEEFAERVAEELRARGYVIRRSVMLDSDALEIPVDVEVWRGVDGSARLVGRAYIAATVAASMVKLCAARCAALVTGERVAVVIPEPARGLPGLEKARSVPVAFYQPDDPVSAADALLALLQGRASPASSPGRGRVVRV